MLKGGGSLLLGPDQRWLGPGDESLLHEQHGSDLIVFHTHDAQTGKPALQISTIVWHHRWPEAGLGNN